MLDTVRHSTLLAAVLSALIAFGMWSNAMAAVFCPHMMGSADCCLMQHTQAHSRDRVGNSHMSADHEVMDHTQMSDMDMQDMSMNMPDMRMGEATSQAENDSVKNEALQLSRDAQEGFEVIADPNEPCSHCLMHSKSGASYPLKSAVQNSSLNEIVSVESRPGIKNNVPSCLTQIDLHDHSPPGSNASRYVLNSAFRI